MDARDLASHLVTASALTLTSASLRAWTKGLSRHGKAACVRAAVAAARTALPAWERMEPSLTAPHERVAAAAAWLEHPDHERALAAGALAFANGDDSGGSSTVTVDGRAIESPEATHAHWAADGAASSAGCADAESAGVAAATAASQAAAALEVIFPVPSVRMHVVMRSMVAALAPHVAEAMGPATTAEETEIAYDGPALGDVALFAPVARRLLALLGGSAAELVPRVTLDDAGIIHSWRSARGGVIELRFDERAAQWTGVITSPHSSVGFDFTGGDERGAGGVFGANTSDVSAARLVAAARELWSTDSR